MQGLDEHKKISILQKSAFGGVDPGLRSTFTYVFYFVLVLLQTINPKLAADLTLNLRYGSHRTLKGNILNYRACSKLVRTEAQE
jgi:hypothetical protein